MPMYYLIKYGDGNSKKYCGDEPALDNNNNVIDFPANNNDCILFKFKQQATGQSGNDGTKDVEIRVPLKYLTKFWIILN